MELLTCLSFQSTILKYYNINLCLKSPYPHITIVIYVLVFRTFNGFELIECEEVRKRERERDWFTLILCDHSHSAALEIYSLVLSSFNVKQNLLVYLFNPCVVFRSN